MAAQNFCDACGKQIHLSAGEIKFRVDLFQTGIGKRGFDLCADDFALIAALIPKYGQPVEA